MAHFAKIVSVNEFIFVVTDVIVAEQDFIDSLADASNWIQTSYNTLSLIHI